ncbi:hypothetical protein EB061_05000 [bacterium]|nr:hypothetical protein [bacterium]
MMDSEYSVGELVLMGFAGPDLSAETLANMKREKISHFILPEGLLPSPNGKKGGRERLPPARI